MPRPVCREKAPLPRSAHSAARRPTLRTAGCSGARTAVSGLTPAEKSATAERGPDGSRRHYRRRHRSGADDWPVLQRHQRHTFVALRGVRLPADRLRQLGSLSELEPGFHVVRAHKHRRNRCAGISERRAGSGDPSRPVRTGAVPGRLLGDFAAAPAASRAPDPSLPAAVPGAPASERRRRQEAGNIDQRQGRCRHRAGCSHFQASRGAAYQRLLSPFDRRHNADSAGQYATQI